MADPRPPSSPPPPPPTRQPSSPGGGATLPAEGIFHVGSLASALLLVGLVASIVGVLAVAAAPTIRRLGFAFLIVSSWDPVHGVFGAAPAITGTLLTSGLALLLAVPVGLGAAIFLAELAPARLRGPLATLLDLSAAVPSVVYGLWGYFVLAPFLRGRIEPALSHGTGGIGPFAGAPFGLDVLTASLVLAAMIVPTVSALSRSALEAVPRVQREAALSLGANRLESLRLSVLGSARGGIAAAIVLALGRAVGETMAVTMTIGNVYRSPSSLLSPGQSIASELANEFNSAGVVEQSALAELGLVLFGIALAVNLGGRWLVGRTAPARAGPARRPGPFRTRRRRPNPASGGPSSPAEGSAEPALPDPSRRRARRRWVHRGFAGLSAAALILAISPLAAVLTTAIQRGGAQVVRPEFYTDSLPPPCHPIAGVVCQSGGIGPAIAGSIALLGIASLIAVPLGLLAGIYLAEYGRGRLAGALSLSADVLTGFPSILVGFFVFLSLASLDPRLVTSSYAGGIALAILMLPLVARSTEVALRAVPAHLREAALALGFPKRRVTLRIAIGNSVAGLLTGLLLAIARAGGETAALLMTTGTSLFYARGLSGPTAALPTLIYNDGLSGYPNWQSVAWGATLVLLAGMLGVGLASRWVLRAAPRAGGAP